MKIAYLTAGAAGMYCGSCMNDNAVARGLIQTGHDCVLIPVYTPIRTDDDDVSVQRVFLGGVNVYLQQKIGLLARVPRFIDAALNQSWLIQWLTQDAGKTSPQLLGALTISMLKGFRGRQRKEFERLMDWLGREVQPDVVVLSNLLIGGCIPYLRDRLGARVFVTLQGDDIFLDSLSDRDRAECELLMQGLVAHTDGFIVHSRAYGQAMAERFRIPSSKLHVVPLAIKAEELRIESSGLVRPDDDEIAIGYLARMAPEKGLHRLVEAFGMLPVKQSDQRLRLRLAGWMGPQHKDYWEQQKLALDLAVRQTSNLRRWDYAGSVDRVGKLDFLSSLDLFCVPTVYAEPKGRFLLEAVALGLPYVMPNHGAFPELHARIQSQADSPRGWLFDTKQSDGLVRTLEEVIATRPKKAIASEWLIREIDMRTHAARLVEVLSAG